MISAGKYVCNTKMNVIKSLCAIPVKNPRTGEVERVYGSWATQESNFITFNKDEPVMLDEQTVNLPHVKHLIENGILKRVY